MIRRLRIAILLFILAGVAISTWQAKYRTTAWNTPLWVAIYPVIGDDTPTVRRYLEGLKDSSFEEIDRYMSEQAALHGLRLPDPLNLQLRSVTDMPPLPPASSVLGTMWWSLKLRWWAWRVEANDGEAPAHVQIFVVLHDPTLRQQVPHSLGLQRGLLGIVHAYASRPNHRRNLVVIAHELLHTLGATDKYDLATLQPQFPDGYADPDQQPRFPQQRAELMGGRIPENAANSHMPDSLAETMIGPVTAREINWAR